MLDLSKDRSAISDAFHQTTADQIRLQEQVSKLKAQTLQYRSNAKMPGKTGLRTLKRINEAEEHLMKALDALTSAHASAEKDAEIAGTPFECPDFIGAHDNVVPIRSEAA